MKHAALTVAVLVYGVMLGHGHTPYFVALMLAAIASDWKTHERNLGGVMRTAVAALAVYPAGWKLIP